MLGRKLVMLNPSLRGTAILLVSLFLAPAFAQNISGVLTGTVKDSAGSVIPSASVKLTNQSTSAAQTITTNDAGVFVFSSVLPGTYSVDVSTPGFRSYQVKDIELTLNERRSLGDIVLPVGQLAEDRKSTRLNSSHMS